MIGQPSITADGKRLAFNRVNSQLDVYVSELSAKAAKASTPRRLTLDDADDLPFDWTPDSKAVIFISNRTGKRNRHAEAASTDLPLRLLSHFAITSNRISIRAKGQTSTGQGFIDEALFTNESLKFLSLDAKALIADDSEKFDHLEFPQLWR
jgi:hypothetical protein